MSGPAPKKITKEDGKALTLANIEDLTTEVLDDCFLNIIHDIVLEVHREEKISRMKSAGVVAEREARIATELARGDADAQNGEPKSAVDAPAPLQPYERTETNGAIVEPDGRIYLKGNPFKTTPTTYCTQCRLPRLLYPTTGFNSRPPPDPEVQYCTLHPFIIKAGHDVHGNPFATDKITNRGKSKKQQQEEKEKESLASSPSTDPSTPLNSSFKSNGNPEKVSFPTVKCPNCPRYLVVTRMAQHLDKCIGLSVRQSSRNAMTKMSTPQESRANTPKPSGNKILKRARTDGDGSGGTGSGDGESPPKKKVKAPPKKKGNDNKPVQSSKLKNGETVNGKKAGTVKKGAGKTTAKKGPGRPPGKKGTPAKTTETNAPATAEGGTGTENAGIKADGGEV